MKYSFTEKYILECVIKLSIIALNYLYGKKNNNEI